MRIHRTLAIQMVAAVFVVLAACSSDSDDPGASQSSDASESTDPTMPWRFVELADGSTGIVTLGTGGWANNGPPFDVEDDVVFAAEAELPAALRQEGYDDIADRLDDYIRWYYGALDGSEQMLDIFLSSCSDEPAEQRDVIPLVLDGGDCTVEARYDIDSGSYEFISPNGG